MIGGVTHHMLPHLPGVPHLHVKRPLIMFKNLCSQLVKALLQKSGYLVQRLQQLKRRRTCTLHEYYIRNFIDMDSKNKVTTLLCEKKNDNKNNIF